MGVMAQNWRAAAPVQRMGIILLLLGPPLLLWQAFPANQIPISQPAFLAVHSIMEIFAVVVAALIFFTAYGTPHAQRSVRVVVLGCAFLAAALFDGLHLLSYEGMPALVTDNSPHKSILFWLCARVSAGIGLLLYVLLPDTRPAGAGERQWMLMATLALTAALSWPILRYPQVLPAMFVPGEGLTPLKIWIEWLVFSLYIATAVLLFLRRRRVRHCDVGSLMLALLLMAVGELFFTMYVQVTNTANMMGHGYKVMAYFFLYRAIFAEAIQQPFQQIRNMLVHDKLTGLASRMSFNERLDEVIREGRQIDESCAVISVGLDRFKTVNATLGHERGDLLLIAVADRIRSTVPEGSFIARFSGDNFMILLERTTPAQAHDIAQRLLHAMQAPFAVADDRLEITASMGVVTSPMDGDTSSVLLRHADVALHHAKTRGRQCVILFSQDLSDTIARRALIEAKLKHALEQNEFHLVYQPKAFLSHGGIGEWEALLRWNSPGVGAISPLEFIPVAEETGIILPMGEWVLRESCRQLAAWRSLGLDPGRVAVNLSTRQLRQVNLPHTIGSILADADLPGSALNLEITESVIMDDPAAASDVLLQLAKQGIRISVDDFGTGYSSLNYLKTLPIHWLKIDQSFISEIPHDENDMAIVRSILRLGHGLGLQVVAEGVETREQLAFLYGEGCDAIQGYLFSPPLPPAECEALMRSGRKLELPDP